MAGARPPALAGAQRGYPRRHRRAAGDPGGATERHTSGDGGKRREQRGRALRAYISSLNQQLRIECQAGQNKGEEEEEEEEMEELEEEEEEGKKEEKEEEVKEEDKVKKAADEKEEEEKKEEKEEVEEKMKFEVATSPRRDRRSPQQLQTWAQVKLAHSPTLDHRLEYGPGGRCHLDFDTTQGVFRFLANLSRSVPTLEVARGRYENGCKYY